MLLGTFRGVRPFRTSTADHGDYGYSCSLPLSLLPITIITTITSQGGTVTDPASSESSSFTLSESVPSANTVDVSGGTETDPGVTVTNICQ
jgi:hypothetical protein